MIDGEFDYSTCSTDELIDVLRHVDAKRFPLNHANAARCLQARSQLLAVAPDESVRGGSLPKSGSDATVGSSPSDCEPVENAHGKRVYSPNRIPGRQRIQLALISLAIFAYGVHGVIVNDLYVPSKRHRGAHLHDLPASIMFGAILCACAVMLSVVLDHYDKRDNEIDYRRFAVIGSRCGLALFLISIGWHLVDQLRKSHAFG